MESKRLNILYIYMHIPNSCHEDWSKMTPTQHGRVCGQCNALVADMTRLSNNEILSLISKGNIHCGRFYEDQLTPPLLRGGFVADWFGKLGKEWMFISLLTMLELAAPFELSAKTILVEQTENRRRDFAGDSGVAMPGYIQGCVIKNSGTSVAPTVNRKVFIYNSKNKCVGKITTDDRGMFAYKLPDGISNEKYTLVLKSYKTHSKYRVVMHERVEVLWAPHEPWVEIRENTSSKKRFLAPKRQIRTGKFR